jgi:hypothetical protein
MARAYTCDITLAFLETDDGDGFLNLLKKYIPDDVALTEAGCISYPHPIWANETIQRLDRNGYATAVQEYTTDHDYFLCERPPSPAYP